ncbi:hypothetical protein GCM10011504_51950 [Siccirubricoccus deserti]|uniref:DUF2332 family protein n=1 Tax=Siccirubricoccus deserti TaxID=2013562 RepID=A0A9X0UK07_9PROT|nr:DUF2332 family protein [Siccirubricoccus deserti]MBC4018655.1 DUF2332 family protein [Siccirubricoccus deserti]GGC67601.1 hypothetical protein GCM10011504_51950 [Siccirubricoccus deserti]
MTPAAEAARNAFAVQASACHERGSPFTGLLCEALGRILDHSTELGRRVLDWPGRPDARGDSVPLRLAAGLHALVRRGGLPHLAAFWPPHPLPEAGAFEAALATALPATEADLLPWLDRAPQTNEPMRSAPLMAGLLAVAAATGGRSFSLHEIGASAGLMLMLDRYEHCLGGATAGTPGARVRIAPGWEGSGPPKARVRVACRHGCDLDPLDVTHPADRERLLAYVWPDQAERLARLEAAIDIAAADPPRLDRADAADWTEAALDPAKLEPGVTRVLMHAVALQYAPETTLARIAAHAARVGAKATGHSPFAWLRFEADPAYDEQGSLRLTLWPDGSERVLALGDTHAERLRWLG